MAKRKKLDNRKLQDQILDKVREGYTDRAICEFFKISPAAFYNYLRASVKFKESVDDAKRIADEPIESALRRKALGFKYEERTFEVVGEDLNPVTGKIEPVKTLKKVTEKYCLPDVDAISFWLTNRHPTIWKHRQSSDINAVVGAYAVPDVSNMSEEEAKKAYEQAVLQGNMKPKKK